MLGYIGKRLLLFIPSLILVTIIVFLLIRFIPGNAIDQIVSEASLQGVEVDRATITHELGLDVPIHIQYFRWIGKIVLHGDFGQSLMTGQSVTQEVLGRIPVTVELGILGLIIGTLFGLFIGIFSAMRQDTLGDYVGRIISILMISIPGFWLASVIIIYPAIWWNWTPPVEYIGLLSDPIKNLSILLLPATILGLTMAGMTMRMTRTLMLEVLRQDYVRTAWAKGLKERTVITRHALQNALIPIITLIGGGLPVLIGGSVIIEQIFAIPGMGRLLLGTIQSRDYPFVSAINLIFAIFVMGSNLLIDIMYSWIDPRVRYR